MTDLPKFKDPPEKYKELYNIQLIKEYYGNSRAARSQVPLINHIYEGIEILDLMDVEVDTIAAFALHPLAQNNVALELNSKRRLLSDKISQKSLLLCMEYRNIANQYLSHRQINSIEEISLSPLIEVNQMLIADKIQNYKDFLIYHLGTHPNSDGLVKYFNNWLYRLNAWDIYYQYDSLYSDKSK